MIIIYTDGACSGNPGPCGIGIVIQKEGKIIKEISESIGQGTNNIAEYSAVLRALVIANDMNEKEIIVKTDSELLVSQLKGIYKIKAPHLKNLYRKIMQLSTNLKISFEHIEREKNKRADALAKHAAQI